MKLSEWLDSQNMSLADLASKLGVSKQAVGGWKSGSFGPSRKHVVALMALSDGAVTVADFVPDASEIAACTQDGIDAPVSP